MGPKSTLRLIRTLGPSLASLAQATWSFSIQCPCGVGLHQIWKPFWGERTSGGHHLDGGSSQPVNRVSQPAGRGRGGGGAPTTLATPTRCGKCGKMGHFARECPDSDVTCFNYQGKGHLSTSCPYSRREKRSGSLNNQSRRPRTTGRVFALSGVDAAQSDDLIQGMCFISQVPLVVLYDSDVTHLFISRVCV